MLFGFAAHVPGPFVVAGDVAADRARHDGAEAVRDRRLPRFTCSTVSVLPVRPSQVVRLNAGAGHLTR